MTTQPTVWLHKAKKRSISVPEYWALPPRRRPRTLAGVVGLVHRKAGIWSLEQRNILTNELEMLQVCENAITDNGALAMFKNTMNASAGGIAVANIIAIDASLGIATVGAISSGGTVTSITVTALTGPTIPSGTTLIINPGQSNKLIVSTTQAITGAQTCTVTSTPGPSGAISAGSFARYATSTDVSGTALSSVPTTDASALTAPVSYSAALPSGQFSISGSGSGNRQMQVSNSGNYLFSTVANSNPSTATAGTYTAAWLVNTSPVSATTQTFAHCPFDSPMTITSSQTIQATIQEKL